jgi:hypothetical protein
MDAILEAAGRTLLSNGLWGVVILGLIYFVMMLRAELRDVRVAHKIELAEKEKLINQLQEARLSEVKVGFEIAKSSQTTLDALLATLRSTK